ncbi:hypothetical protein KIN20_016109 [Parelaphostrongylus tenuis]|uniref:Major facilitator superfamily (MFS) profile domain-containing protein n=1 Tax=Parelaphostrongylus tenuis TaxID=148309 RepID=A0AAD5QPI1_PARTN|nr:hypothetical protein KIN20_016109 [Parelaphostrongylus tenuis]
MVGSASSSRNELSLSSQSLVLSAVHDVEEKSMEYVSNDEATTRSTKTSSMTKSDDFRTAKLPHFSLFSFRSTRLWICILLTTGLYSTVSMRLNLSMAVVCMVNSTAFPSEKPTSSVRSGATTSTNCEPLNSDFETAVDAGYTGDLLWSPAMQSVLFSATFYGAMVTLPFAGILADKYGAKSIVLGRHNTVN